jgi:hypothetical protein
VKAIKIRDIIFGGLGAAILYHEVVVSKTAEPLLVFAAFFLLGLVPASRADDAIKGNSSVKEAVRGWLGEDEDKPK